MPLDRPFPPAILLEPAEESPLFLPAYEVEEWARSAFIGELAELRNPEHDHLADASIRCLWTNAVAVRNGRETLGTCEIFQPRGKPWVKARQEAQVREWFGGEPFNFLLTFSAPFAVTCSDLGWCVLVEHELAHCGHRHGADGPLFSKSTGKPVFYLRPHDIEEFTMIARRYGLATPAIAELVAAAQEAPEIGAAGLTGICGTCGAQLAA